ncbi:translation initiation factor IF-2-like [Trachemys scripta elegans]|uniref:translation initiation factor IF-2-like n=1 Tax=Trachemys scripta elegans TaxID=31138 RepID=UPI001554E356|nr:translation initiation factor IF-2-like [Trachemys scripta elegans]
MQTGGQASFSWVCCQVGCGRGRSKSYPGFTHCVPPSIPCSRCSPGALSREEWNTRAVNLSVLDSLQASPSALLLRPGSCSASPAGPCRARAPHSPTSSSALPGGRGCRALLSLGGQSSRRPAPPASPSSCGPGLPSAGRAPSPAAPRASTLVPAPAQALRPTGGWGEPSTQLRQRQRHGYTPWQLKQRRPNLHTPYPAGTGATAPKHPSRSFLSALPQHNRPDPLDPQGEWSQAALFPPVTRPAALSSACWPRTTEPGSGALQWMSGQVSTSNHWLTPSQEHPGQAPGALLRAQKACPIAERCIRIGKGAKKGHKNRQGMEQLLYEQR